MSSGASQSVISEIVKDFLIESEEGLGVITSGITHLEKNPEDTETINEIYRALHTMKGSACFFQFKKLEKLTHTAETLLGDFRDNGRKVTSESIDFLLHCVDLIQVLIKEVESQGQELEGNAEDIEKELIAFAKSINFSLSGAEAIANEAVETTPQPEENLIMQDSVSEEHAELVDQIHASVVDKVNEEVAQMEDVLVLEVPAVQEVPIEEEPKEESKEDLNISSNSKKNISDSTIRVNVSLLDKIMNVAGELVLNRNQILQFANKSDNNEVIKLASQLDIITTELQSDIMATRM